MYSKAKELHTKKPEKTKESDKVSGAQEAQAMFQLANGEVTEPEP